MFRIQWEQHHLVAWNMYYSVSSTLERQCPWLSPPDWWSWPKSRFAGFLNTLWRRKEFKSGSVFIRSVSAPFLEIWVWRKRERVVFSDTWWVPWHTGDTCSCIKDVQKCILHDRSPLNNGFPWIASHPANPLRPSWDVNPWYCVIYLLTRWKRMQLCYELRLAVRALSPSG